ncbi:MAG: AbrB/MazE/SpoVT family DNA-binding domain-containing protein [Oscillospiraceae bacterium]|jgi:AbrB family looped-hinge helix DNA binding protein|nr:AbrB/MazE/SpoVT family DNA-binding domain-containing protein [Oscillospiraceae bacterium]
MNLARLSQSGQITVPAEIRRKLNLNAGDKLLFWEKENGEILVGNAAVMAIYKAQEAFRGVAEELGLQGDDDVQRMVDEFRYGGGATA